MDFCHDAHLQRMNGQIHFTSIAIWCQGEEVRATFAPKSWTCCAASGGFAYPVRERKTPKVPKKGNIGSLAHPAGFEPTGFRVGVEHFIL